MSTDRRVFLSQLAATSLVLGRAAMATGATGTLLACAGRQADRSRAPEGQSLESLVGPEQIAADAGEFPLAEWSIDDLQSAMSAGRYTAEAITGLYLGRVDALNRRGPALNAVIETNPDALADAVALDAERAAGRVRGPLHGVPVLLKDNIETGDKTMTTAGSRALQGHIADRDAEVARRLRAAGAVLMGKANLSEWANFRSTHSSSGWSGRGGQCKNPYVLDRNPCGSSSGSGVAVAANMCSVAIGTETDGSVVCPSSSNGIVGIKPTLGLASRTGIIPLAHSQDTAGPMARSVTDAALVLAAMAGRDASDLATLDPKARFERDYRPALVSEGLQGARIGVVRSFFGFSPDVDALMERAMADMRAGGAIVVDEVEIPHLAELDALEWEVLLYEFKADLNGYLAKISGRAQIGSVEELIEFNRRDADRSMPHFDQEILEMASRKGPLSEAAYREAQAKAKQLAGPQGIDAALKNAGVDALMAPTGGPAWVTDHVNGDHFSGGSSTPAAVSGYPNITVPAGAVRGLPVGVSLFSRAWSESTLLRLAYAYEQASGHRQRPQFLPTLPKASGLVSS